MKKGTLMLISSLIIILFTLSYCKETKKPLFYQEDGNYFVDNNFIIRSAAAMSSQDVDQLIALEADTNYTRLTKGACILLNIARTTNILRTNQLTIFDRIQRLSRLDKIQKILDIHKGCFEVQQIDWTQFGDLKSKLDAILNKYNPALINGNISITNNQIATAAVELKADDVAQLDKITAIGAEEVNICGDYMGPNRYTRILKTVKTLKPDMTLDKSLNKILVAYNVK